MAADLEGTDALLARIDALERDRRRSFDAAQREADALFAQYQLSQLIASGGTLAGLAEAVLAELIRLADGSGGALYLGSPDEQATLAARIGVEPEPSRPRRTLVLDEGPPPTTVVLWPRPDAPLDEEGVRIALLARHELAVAFDSASLQETLEQERHELGAIVDGATDCILQVDAEGRVIRLNPAGVRLLGADAGTAIGRHCGDVLGCEVAGGHGVAACPLAEVLAGGAPIAYRETAVRGAAGAPVRVAGSYAATMTGGAGGTARATAILRDISAVAALEQLREGFVATVSHELRTPLALIRGYAETLLHMDLEPAQQRAYVERIDEASARLAALVDQVLDVTHLQADPLILERSTTTFDDLVARLRGELAVAGGVERVIVDAPQGLPAVDVDVVRVGQILSNLVGNARKYAPDASPIVIGATVEGDWLALTVDDEGVGIPEAERGLVTEPFHRAWNVRESRIPGTGLGLFICRRLAEAHGGTLSVADRPDGRPGTRVRFTLPLATATAAADADRG